jgi:hypothetical protein
MTLSELEILETIRTWYPVTLWRGVHGQCCDRAYQHYELDMFPGNHDLNAWKEWKKHHVCENEKLRNEGSALLRLLLKVLVEPDHEPLDLPLADDAESSGDSPSF